MCLSDLLRSLEDRHTPYFSLTREAKALQICDHISHTCTRGGGESVKQYHARVLHTVPIPLVENTIPNGTPVPLYIFCSRMCILLHSHHHAHCVQHCHVNSSEFKSNFCHEALQPQSTEHPVLWVREEKLIHFTEKLICHSSNCICTIQVWT